MTNGTLETLRNKKIEAEELLLALNGLSEQEKNNLYFIIKGFELKNNSKKLPTAIGM